MKKNSILQRSPGKAGFLFGLVLLGLCWSCNDDETGTISYDPTQPVVLKLLLSRFREITRSRWF